MQFYSLRIPLHSCAYSDPMESKLDPRQFYLKLDVFLPKLTTLDAIFSGTRVPVRSKWKVVFNIYFLHFSNADCQTVFSQVPQVNYRIFLFILDTEVPYSDPTTAFRITSTVPVLVLVLVLILVLVLVLVLVLSKSDFIVL
jgi:hypothetical protein